MDLWIRSQDKRCLIEVNNLYTENGRIILLAKTGGRVTIGSYKSRERALEVLDEIQNLFNLSIQNETFERSDLIIKAFMLPKVYEMPQE